MTCILSIIIMPSLYASSVAAWAIGRWITEYKTEELQPIFNKFNASGKVSVPFYNLSKPYSKDVETGDDWELSLRTVASIPVPKSKDAFFSGIEIALTPPVSMKNDERGLDVADGWHSCENYLFAVEIEKEKDIHPRCQGMFTDACWQKLQEYLKSGNCTGFSAFPECKAEETGDGTEFNTGQKIMKNSTFVGYDQPRGNGNHTLGDYFEYDKAISRMYVVATSVGRHTNKTDETNGDEFLKNFEQGSRLPGTLSCVRVNNFTEGSRTFSAASNTGVGVVGLLCAMVVSTMLLV